MIMQKCVCHDLIQVRWYKTSLVSIYRETNSSPPWWWGFQYSLLTFDPSCRFPWLDSTMMTSLTINQVHKYQKKGHRHSTITKYQNINFISGHQTCHLIGDVLSKHLHKSKGMMTQRMNGLVVSLSAETFLNTVQFCLVIKPSSWIRSFSVFMHVIQIMCKMLNILIRSSVKFEAPQ